MTSASSLPAIIAALTFAAVILAIALDWLDLVVAGLLGAVLLRVLGIVSQKTAVSSINTGFDTIGLFFGGMVVARALIPDWNFRLSRRMGTAIGPRRRPFAITFDNCPDRTDLRDPAQRYGRHPVRALAHSSMPQDGNRFHAADNFVGFCRQQRRVADPGW
jgi:hypothetical protein